MINNKDNSFFKDLKKNTLNFILLIMKEIIFVQKIKLKKLIITIKIAFKYSDKDGNIDEKNNPNGSIKNIAGIFNKEKNVLGMMPHPERMIDPALSGEDGSIFFENLINNLK